MKLEFELGDNGKVTASPSNCPKQVGVFIFAGSDPLASAVTTSTEIRLSTVMPYLRVNQPNPPPSIRPAIPVVELIPTGVASPWDCAASSKSASVAPGST